MRKSKHAHKLANRQVILKAKLRLASRLLGLTVNGKALLLAVPLTDVGTIPAKV